MRVHDHRDLGGATGCAAVPSGRDAVHGGPGRPAHRLCACTERTLHEIRNHGALHGRFLERGAKAGEKAVRISRTWLL